MDAVPRRTGKWSALLVRCKPSQMQAFLKTVCSFLVKECSRQDKVVTIGLVGHAISERGEFAVHDLLANFGCRCRTKSILSCPVDDSTGVWHPTKQIPAHSEQF